MIEIRKVLETNEAIGNLNELGEKKLAEFRAQDKTTEKIDLKEFMKRSSLKRNAVLNAIADGRIKSAFKNEKNQWEFEADLALAEYKANTNPNLSSNSQIEDQPSGDPSENPLKRKSVFDIDDKYWTVQEATQARSIWEARKTKLSFEAAENKYYPKKDVDEQFKKITKMFSTGLLTLPDKFRQKHHDLTKPMLKDLEKLCRDLSEEVSKKL